MQGNENLATRMISAQEAARLMSVTVQTARKMVSSGTLPASFTCARGGRSGVNYLISVADLPREAQVLWEIEQDRSGALDVDLAGYKERYGQDGLEELLARRHAVAECATLSGMRNALEGKKEIAERYGISLRRLYELCKAYEAKGVAGLMRSMGRSDKGQARTMCAMAKDFIINRYCSASQVTMNKTLSNLKELAASLGAGACDICPHNLGSPYRAEMIRSGAVDEYAPCDQAGGGLIVPQSRCAVNRFVEHIPKQVIDAGRLGWSYWEAHYQPKALREKPETVNEVWFGDHHVFDLFVMLNGKPVRPWLTAWMDAKSNVIVGWALSVNPNSDTIVEALTSGIAHTVGSPFYGLPMMLYIDNGKDYRCKRLEGKSLQDYELGQLNVDFRAENPLLETLGIGVTHAIPYRAWSKTIERVFGTIEPRWIRELPGWCGNGIDAKPETLMQDIRQGKLMSFEEFAAYWTNVILPGYHAFKAEGVTQSPMEIYQASDKARSEVPSYAALAVAKAMKTTRVVQTTGVRLDNHWYWDAAMADLVGQTVTLLHDKRYTGRVTVLYDGSYVCEAFAKERMKLVGEDEEKLQAHLREQQVAKRGIRQALVLPRERVRMLDQIITERPDLTQASSVTSLVHERIYREQQQARATQMAATREEHKAGEQMYRRLAQEGAELLRRREAT